MRMLAAIALAATLHASVLAATGSRGTRDGGRPAPIPVTLTTQRAKAYAVAAPAGRDQATRWLSSSAVTSAAPSSTRPPRARQGPFRGSPVPLASTTPRSPTIEVSHAAPADVVAVAGPATTLQSAAGDVAASGGGAATGGDRAAPGGSGAGGAITAGGEGGAGVGEDDLARRIRARIAAHRRYPALARRRGIEGTVRLSLAVRPDGSVEVRVVRGADPMLDEAAREAVLASAPLPVVRERLEIELEYRLTEP